MKGRLALLSMPRGRVNTHIRLPTSPRTSQAAAGVNRGARSVHRSAIRLPEPRCARLKLRRLHITLYRLSACGMQLYAEGTHRAEALLHNAQAQVRNRSRADKPSSGMSLLEVRLNPHA